MSKLPEDILEGGRRIEAKARYWARKFLDQRAVERHRESCKKSNRKLRAKQKKEESEDIDQAASHSACPGSRSKRLKTTHSSAAGPDPGLTSPSRGPGSQRVSGSQAKPPLPSMSPANSSIASQGVATPGINTEPAFSFDLPPPQRSPSPPQDEQSTSGLAADSKRRNFRDTPINQLPYTLRRQIKVLNRIGQGM